MTADVSEPDSDEMFMPLSFLARTRRVLNADHRPSTKNVRATNAEMKETTSRVKSSMASSVSNHKMLVVSFTSLKPKTESGK